jgi:hypothetical protein
MGTEDIDVEGDALACDMEPKRKLGHQDRFFE